MFENSRPQPLFIAIATAIIVLMFTLGAQPFAAGLFQSPWDKLAHFIAYATLTVLLRIGIGGGKPWLLVVLIGIIGGFDEWRQITIPGRSAELADLATNIAAAVVAIMVCEWHAKNRQPSLPASDHSN
ncbi:MAG: VanZ family protein [Rhodocyclaceae bacterium]|nr:VanZ family protein [Rhodocyclaceae bacterium]MDZ4214001.1 VanZ family protein [Rhodocyclaceae bacterium]